MINRIHLQNVNLVVFVNASPDGGPSEIWEQDICFEKGKSYLIESASGRGKSSFCSFVYGLRNDFVGTIDLTNNETSIKRTSVDVKNYAISMMFQDLRLFPELTAIENVQLKNQITHFKTEQEIIDMLSRVGLADRLNRPCGKLSFGQQQRVAFVRLLCQPADFLFLDEPVSHLDDVNNQIMGEMIRERQEKDSVGIIVTSIGRRLQYDYDKILTL